MSTLSDQVAERVVRLRQAAGLTREQLATEVTRLGLPLSAATLGNIETGRRGTDGRRRREVTVDELAGLAAALDVAPAWLLGTAQDGTDGADETQVMLVLISTPRRSGRPA